ncbi:putative methyltransferase DDB_G0268948 [Clupea harengus]|uniref:Methyltransferase DDB_G0268948 n=1 Tax=Clupea harengus TaxID=7950 RepID=A0A6P3W6N2_CLUHA|nr:putative methyltransferase DDB_G0268948 [Clupea harengus]
MSVRLFEGKEHALYYWKYRISPSEEIINKILNFLEKHRSRPFDLAVDVGCGTGQGTVLLGPYFSKVVGTDVSPAQLEMALQHSIAQNITYRECPAEQLPLENGKVDLVTSMSAFHWFDHPRFLKEVDRILKPQGCLALLNYTMDMELSYGDCSEALNQICKELYAALLPHRNPYLGASSLDLYKKTYGALEYPTKEWHENLWVRKSIPLSSYIGMMESFSNYQALLRKDPEKARKLSQDITERLLKAIGVTSPDVEVVLSVRYYCLLACKP